jgi:hypothetical protein
VAAKVCQPVEVSLGPAVQGARPQVGRDMEFRILGPLEVAVADTLLSIAGAAPPTH